jgi:insertion element IS1 protein InsB
MPLVRLQFHNDAAAWQTPGDEGAGFAALRDGQHEFRLDSADSRGQRRRRPELDSRRSAQTPRSRHRCGAGHHHGRRDVAFHPKKTQKLWIWRAYDPLARRTVAWVIGRRDDATCQKLLDKIGLEGKTFVTDDWDGYHRLIPEEQLFTGKDLTVFIEQDNSNIRHFLARFRRRTKVVSKSEEMVDLSLRLYHHLHDNLESLIAKISIFRSIFS